MISRMQHVCAVSVVCCEGMTVACCGPVAVSVVCVHSRATW